MAGKEHVAQHGGQGACVGKSLCAIAMCKQHARARTCKNMFDAGIGCSHSWNHSHIRGGKRGEGGAPPPLGSQQANTRSNHPATLSLKYRASKAAH